MFLPDRLARQALVLAVVPFGQIRSYLHAVTEPGQLSCLRGPLQRAREHAGELELAKHGPQRPRPFDARRKQGQVGVAGVPAVLTPLGVAVTDEHQPRLVHAATRSSSCAASNAAPSTPAVAWKRASRTLA